MDLIILVSVVGEVVVNDRVDVHHPRGPRLGMEEPDYRGRVTRREGGKERERGKKIPGDCFAPSAVSQPLGVHCNLALGLLVVCRRISTLTKAS